MQSLWTKHAKIHAKTVQLGLPRGCDSYGFRLALKTRKAALETARIPSSIHKTGQY